MIKVFEVGEAHRQELDDGGYGKSYSSYFQAARLVGRWTREELPWHEQFRGGTEKWKEVGCTREARSLLEAAQIILDLPEPAPGWYDRDETGFLTLPRGIRWGEFWVRLESIGKGTRRREWLSLYSQEEWDKIQAEVCTAVAAEQEAANRRFHEKLRREAELDRRRLEEKQAAAEKARSQRTSFFDLYGAKRSSKRNTCPVCGADSPPGEHICDIEEE